MVMIWTQAALQEGSIDVYKIYRCSLAILGVLTYIGLFVFVVLSPKDGKSTTMATVVDKLQM
jgi:hypothetical protein